MTTSLSLDLDQLIDARPETVFRLLTEPDLYAQWFGPDGATVTVEEMEVVLGGRLALHISFPDADIEIGIECFYEVIEPPRVLVHTWRPTDEELVTSVRFELEPQGAQTRLILIHQGFVDPVDLEQHQSGWLELLPKLARTAAALQTTA